MNPCSKESVIDEIKQDINELKVINMGFNKDIQNLCVKIDSLICTLDWAVKLVLGTVILAVLGLVLKSGL